jgi:SAM-dependent methyltransferase
METRYAAIRKAIRRLKVEFLPERHPFDQRHGVDTSGWVALPRLHIASPNKSQGVHYQGVEPEIFQQALSAAKINPRNYTFIDLGCGKGRALLLASQEGFQRGIGVEFSPHLAQIARDNLSRVGVSNFEVVCQDATEFRFPSQPLFVFLYNPFSAEVLDQVVQNLTSHRDELIIAYVEPIHRGRIAREKSFKWIATEKAYCVWKLEMSDLGHA